MDKLTSLACVACAAGISPIVVDFYGVERPRAVCVAVSCAAGWLALVTVKGQGRYGWGVPK